jgi:hypothetical protein
VQCLVADHRSRSPTSVSSTASRCGRR